MDPEISGHPVRTASGHDVVVSLTRSSVEVGDRLRRRHRARRPVRSSHNSSCSAVRCAVARRNCISHVVNRYYDPSSYQFLNIDPKVGTTMQPYAFVSGNPLNGTDPLGLATSAWWRDIVDVPQDLAYLGYWGSYEAASHIDTVGCHLGHASCVASHIAVIPFVPLEAAGLGLDALGNRAKGESIWQEGYRKQPFFGNQTGGRKLSREFQSATGWKFFTNMRFPGLEHNHKIDWAW